MRVSALLVQRVGDRRCGRRLRRARPRLRRLARRRTRERRRRSPASTSAGRPPREARSMLERRADALAAVPVTFRVGRAHWQLQPRQPRRRGRLGARPSTPAPTRATASARSAASAASTCASSAPTSRRRRRCYDGRSATSSAGSRRRSTARTARRRSSCAACSPSSSPRSTGGSLDRDAAGARSSARSRASSAAPRRRCRCASTRRRCTAADLDAGRAAQVRTALLGPVRLTLGADALVAAAARSIAAILELPRGRRADARDRRARRDRYFASARPRRSTSRRADADFGVARHGRVGRGPGAARPRASPPCRDRRAGILAAALVAAPSPHGAARRRATPAADSGRPPRRRRWASRGRVGRLQDVLRRRPEPDPQRPARRRTCRRRS